MVVRRSRANYLIWLFIFVVGLFVLYQFSMAGKKQMPLVKRVEAEMFEGQKKGTFAFFYADWCGHCQRAKPAWNELEQNSDSLPCELKKINADEDQAMVQKHGVSGFPTIRYYPNGLDDVENRTEYTGDRSYSGFKSFLSSF